MAVKAFTLPDKYSESSKNSGKGVASFTKTISVLAADDDTSIYVIGYVPAGALLTSIEIANSTITAGTDYDIGLYDKDGTVISVDFCLDAGDLSSAHALGSELSGLSNMAISDKGRALYLALSKTLRTKDEGYYLAFYANTVGSADGTIVVTVSYIN